MKTMGKISGIIYKSVVFLICVLIFLVLGLIILLETHRYLNTREAGTARDRNYVVLDYWDGELIIYQAGDEGGRVRFPARTEDFAVLRGGPVWELRLAGPEKGCTNQDERVAMSRVVYGIAPLCYVEKKPAKPLKKNIRYTIKSGYSTARREKVFFKLVDCPKNPAKTCMETNSPVNDD